MSAKSAAETAGGGERIQTVVVMTVTVLLVAVAALYCLQIVTGALPDPVLMQWVAWASASGMSLWTYFRTEKPSALKNIVNVLDTTTMVAILLIVVFFARDVRYAFNIADRIVIGGLLMIGIFCWCSRNAVTANVLTQALIALGYLPLWWKLWHATSNTEPFFVYTTVALASFIGLYPAVKGRDRLATLFAGRVFVQISVTLLLMLRLKLGDP